MTAERTAAPAAAKALSAKPKSKSEADGTDFDSSFLGLPSLLIPSISTLVVVVVAAAAVIHEGKLCLDDPAISSSFFSSLSSAIH
jgi:hypothetical protein